MFARPIYIFIVQTSALHAHFIPIRVFPFHSVYCLVKYVSSIVHFMHFINLPLKPLLYRAYLISLSYPRAITKNNILSHILILTIVSTINHTPIEVIPLVTYSPCWYLIQHMWIFRHTGPYVADTEKGEGVEKVKYKSFPNDQGYLLIFLGNTNI